MKETEHKKFRISPKIKAFVIYFFIQIICNSTIFLLSDKFDTFKFNGTLGYYIISTLLSISLYLLLMFKNPGYLSLDLPLSTDNSAKTESNLTKMTS